MKYCKEMKKLVRENNLAMGNDPKKKIVVHHVTPIGKMIANSAVLMGAFMILDLN